MSANARSVLPILALLLLAAPAGAGAKDDKEIKVETWHDRAIDFGAYRSFDFDYTPPPGSRRTRGELTRDREIRAYIAEALEAKGYVHDTEGEVDFLIQCIYHPPVSRAGGGRAGVSGRMTRAFGRSNDNQLYLELSHPQTRQPVWRGTARKVLTKKHDTSERLRAAVVAAIDAFPPPPHAPPAAAEESPTPADDDGV